MKAAKTQRRYLKIDDTVFNSEAFKTLPPSAVKLWLDMRTQFKGSNNGDISATMSLLVHRGWASTETLYRALGELLARGLIDRTRHGKPGPYRLCSLFRFTDLPCAKNEEKFIDGKPATYDFMNWAPQQKKNTASKIEATLLRKSERYNFGNGSVDADAASEIEARRNGENHPIREAQQEPTLKSGVQQATLRKSNISIVTMGEGAIRSGDGVEGVDLESDLELRARPESKRNSAAIKPLPKPDNEFDHSKLRWQARVARRAAAKRV